ncbi:hypothetical protein M2319_001989 [Rhodobium gokarnense]|uniref:Uncharacterized protein n=1 Tax=Rhodobium gokarnense TaxID=364296 RepID=A0ABT3HB78_9HYPH|nr:hypothetical protein [Rhodobium gokarnense]
MDVIAFLGRMERRKGQAGFGPERGHDALAPADSLDDLLERAVFPAVDCRAVIGRQVTGRSCSSRIGGVSIGVDDCPPQRRPILPPCGTPVSGPRWRSRTGPAGGGLFACFEAPTLVAGLSEDKQDGFEHGPVFGGTIVQCRVRSPWKSITSASRSAQRHFTWSRSACQPKSRQCCDLATGVATKQKRTGKGCPCQFDFRCA